MATFTEEVTIDFATTEDPNIREWLKTIGVDPASIPELTFKADVAIDLDVEDFSEAEIISAFTDIAEGNWLERAYRYAAEGDSRAVLDELHAAFPHLRPPHTELALVARLGTAGGAARG